MSGDLSISKANEAMLQATLKTLKQQSEVADASTREYISTIQTLRKERDSLRRAVQAARKTDEDYRKWADTHLPHFVVDKYNGVHKDAAARDGRNSERPQGPVD